jgi:hypothetical protein
MTTTLPPRGSRGADSRGADGHAVVVSDGPEVVASGADVVVEDVAANTRGDVTCRLLAQALATTSKASTAGVRRISYSLAPRCR